jgi:hydroxymethylbilane synthase
LTAQKIRIGTRGSALALTQARLVADAITRSGPDAAVEIVPITTSGDRGADSDKSRFVKEIEQALLEGRVDLAVHSAKDVPGALPAGLGIVGAPAAEDPRDVLIGCASIDDLRQGATVGTSSLRRRSQLLALRPDLQPAELRGNVDTRLTKLAEGGYDAIVLALAGLRRLGREPEAGAPIPSDDLVPAPGQGILALEGREGDERIAALGERLSDAAAVARLRAERALVSELEASCHTPIGALAELREDGIRMRAYVGLPDGSEWIRDELHAGPDDPEQVGSALARRLLAAGAGELLQRADRLAAGRS